MPRLGINDIVKTAAPLVCLTAYTTEMARLLDAHVDVLLVGDSLGMVVYGAPNTLSVTLDMMIRHGASVVQGAEHALVVVDMPFGTYEHSRETALENARRMMAETGCRAVKLEGGADMAATIRHLVDHDIPVMGHIGLLPQSVEKMGGYKIQGRGEAGASRLLDDARQVEEAGAFAIVIEGTIEPVARAVTESVKVPTIGIGASSACDGQILVINDLLGLTKKPPRFAKKFVNLSPLIEDAVKAYAAEVKARRFPGPEHVFGET